ncbi:GNAT family N-acetyltransferase [Kitasatospora viridis]|uniref:Acetyltransferase (GNAT) family protein n=1 Tax=Kitasatospora viridis TaxID=281105 RepID=A0A561UMT1_9ACTN|nr:GNAT family N-acetyltransferase [Kitasatospora viridis]TWG00678.1 acetyltransferase (GNAT) family protein [Kitasatospora viridis]
MIFRTATEDDLDSLLPVLAADPGSGTVTPENYRAKLADGQYRLEHTWLAVDRDDRVAAAAVWWGSGEPRALDGVFGGDEEVAAELLRTAHAAFGTAPEFHVFLPADWRERAEVRAALDWRLRAARAAGLTAELERLRFDWRAGRDAVPEADRRLRYAAEPDDAVIAELFARVLAGSLDHGSTAGAARQGAEAQAREDLEFYRDTMLGERSWWRVARNGAGETVGFAIPSRNPGAHVVGYLGVLPEHRGHGYAEQFLGEITRILVAEAGATEIRADTDLGNLPMAAAFRRAGYRDGQRRLVLSAE